MLSRTQTRISFSMTAGGGVLGKGAGIAHGTIIPAGSIIEGFHRFIQEYQEVGGTTTGSIVGGDINGTTSAYLTNKSNKTGEPGKSAGTGKSKIPGVSKV